MRLIAIREELEAQAVFSEDEIKALVCLHEQVTQTAKLTEYLVRDFSSPDTGSEASVKKLAVIQRYLADELTTVKEIKSHVSGVYDLVRNRILPDRMQEEGITSIKIQDIGTCFTETDVHASVKSENKAKFFEWLEENGHGNLIQDSVHASTLKSLVKDYIKRGDELPEDLINVTPYQKTKILKQKGLKND